MPTAAFAAAGAIGGKLIKSSASKSASKAQAKGQATALAATKAATDQARGDAIPLFQSAQDNALKGFQSALDIFGQNTPQQLNAVQMGSTGAQKTLLAGLDPQIAAILGGNVDLSQLVPRKQPLPDPSSFNLQLPDFTTINEALNQPQAFDPTQFLRGRRFGGR